MLRRSSASIMAADEGRRKALRQKTPSSKIANEEDHTMAWTDAHYRKSHFST